MNEDMEGEGGVEREEYGLGSMGVAGVDKVGVEEK